MSSTKYAKKTFEFHGSGVNLSGSFRFIGGFIPRVLANTEKHLPVRQFADKEYLKIANRMVVKYILNV